jgi:hypothetical protein
MEDEMNMIESQSLLENNHQLSVGIRTGLPIALFSISLFIVLI